MLKFSEIFEFSKKFSGKSKRLRRVEGQKHRLFSASLFVGEGFFLENGDVAEIQM